MQLDLRRNVQAVKLWRSHVAATASTPGRNPKRSRERAIRASREGAGADSGRAMREPTFVARSHRLTE